MGGVAPPLLLAGIPKKGLSPPINDKARYRVVFDFKNIYENVDFYFYSTSMFVKYLAIRIISELNYGNFHNLHE